MTTKYSTSPLLITHPLYNYIYILLSFMNEYPQNMFNPALVSQTIPWNNKHSFPSKIKSSLNFNQNSLPFTFQNKQQLRYFNTDDKQKIEYELYVNNEKDSQPLQSPSNIIETEDENNEEVIQVHAFRSLITISPNPDNIQLADMDLSRSERLFISKQKLTHQKLLHLSAKQNPHKILMKAKHELSEMEDSLISNSSSSFSPPIAYQIWNAPPEVYDRIYGFEADCEPPDRENLSWYWLYKIWGYYSVREVRYRCSIYCYMKSQRRRANELFWNTFELENTFRVELQLLCLHLWFAKTRMHSLYNTAENIKNIKKVQKLSSRTFQMMFDQLPSRFLKHVQGQRSRWQMDCQQACLHLCVSLDHALEDYELGDKQAISKVVWNELYLSNRDMSHDLLYLWTEYILKNVSHLKSVTDNEFFNGWWTFVDVPTEDDRMRVRQQLIDQQNDTE